MKSMSWESMKLLFLDGKLLSNSHKPETAGLYKQWEDSTFYKI